MCGIIRGMKKQKQSEPEALKQYHDDVAKAREIIKTAADYNKLQLSNKVLQGMIRGLVPTAIETLAELLHSEHPTARLGAAKLIMNKVLPDLKAIELSDNRDLSGLIIVRSSSDDVINGELVTTAESTIKAAKKTDKSTKTSKDNPPSK